MAHCWFNIAEAVAIYVNPPSPVVTRESPHMPEVVTIIKSKGRTFTSSYEEEAAAMESALSWTRTKPTVIHSLFSFVQTVSPCVKPSYHHILERTPFAIP